MNRITRILGTTLTAMVLSSAIATGVAAQGTSTPGTSNVGEIVVVSGKAGQWYKVNYDLNDGFFQKNNPEIWAKMNQCTDFGRIPSSGVDLLGYEAIDLQTMPNFLGNEKTVLTPEDPVPTSGEETTPETTAQPSEEPTKVETPKEEAPKKDTSKAETPKKDTAKDETPKADTSSTESTLSGGEKIVQIARKYIGVPYVWGGSSPSGFDCSGFTQYVMRSAGISIPRTTTEQYQMGTSVSKSDLQPGDLVFLKDTYRTGISHVGIYIGNGQVIHASSSHGVTIAELSGSFFSQHYYGSRRVL